MPPPRVWEVAAFIPLGCLHPPQPPLTPSTAHAAHFVEIKRCDASANRSWGSPGAGMWLRAEPETGQTPRHGPGWAGDGQAAHPSPMGALMMQ